MRVLTRAGGICEPMRLARHDVDFGFIPRLFYDPPRDDTTNERSGPLRDSRFLALSVLLLALCVAAGAAAQEAPAPTPDVIYVPTPQAVVDAMLDVANVGPGDVVYDLGCGDGRIVVTAAEKHGARGVGIDIDPRRIKEANNNVAEAGVSDLVEIRNGDLFETDLSEASVVTLYLLSSLNLKLRPKLWKELKVDSRVVSHAFSMGDWEPEQVLDVNGRTVYYWTITEDLKQGAP